VGGEEDRRGSEAGVSRRRRICSNQRRGWGKKASTEAYGQRRGVQNGRKKRRAQSRGGVTCTGVCLDIPKMGKIGLGGVVENVRRGTLSQSGGETRRRKEQKNKTF